MYSYNYDYDMYNRIYHMSAGSTLFSLLLSALVIVALWFLFVKAKEPGWAAIVPFYNTFVLFKITWGNGWLFLLMLIPIANIVIYIITMVKLANAFGKGGGWACGLIFLPIIFLPITAFSKEIVYVGVPDKTAAYGPGYGQPGYQQPDYQSPYSPDYQNPQHNNLQQPLAESSPKYCASCGAQLVSNEKYCPKCGKQQ